MNIEMVIGGLVLLAIIAYRVYGRSSNKPSTEKETPPKTKDILAEVSVFLAYEKFNQAEEFIKVAIAGDPGNLEFHSKLLEVFYAANNNERPRKTLNYETPAERSNACVASTG